MKKVLVVVDMQNDFLSGALGSRDAEKIIPNVKRLIKDFKGEVIFTRDTHGEDYLSTREGRYLPVAHCIRGSQGWQITDELETLGRRIFDKSTFGSVHLAKYLAEINERAGLESVTLVGVCTDICVISNAMLIKAYLPEVDVIVDASCCAGVSRESHENALSAMRACQIEVVNA